MSTEARTAFKIRNWVKYNEALVNRGDITIWFSDEIIAQWKHENENQGQGRPFVFSDMAIPDSTALCKRAKKASTDELRRASCTRRMDCEYTRGKVERHGGFGSMQTSRQELDRSRRPRRRNLCRKLKTKIKQTAYSTHQFVNTWINFD